MGTQAIVKNKPFYSAFSVFAFSDQSILWRNVYKKWSSEAQILNIWHLAVSSDQSEGNTTTEIFSLPLFFISLLAFVKSLLLLRYKQKSILRLVKARPLLNSDIFLRQQERSTRRVSKQLFAIEMQNDIRKKLAELVAAFFRLLT